VAALAVLAGGVRATDEALRKKALAFNDVTGDDSARAEIRALLRDPAGTRKLLAEAARMAGEKEQPLHLNAVYLLARTAQALKETDAGLALYRVYAGQAQQLQSARKLAQAYDGLIQMLYDAGQYDECVKTCRQFLDLEGDDLAPLKPAVQRRRVLALAKLGEVDKANRILDRMIDANPHDYLNVEMRARLLRELNKTDQAARVYLDILEQVKKDDELKKETRETYVTDLRYALSGVYIDLRAADKAAEQLLLLLEKDPDNPTYNNDLGYVWADHNLNLDQAEKHIRRALAEDRKQRRQDGDDDHDQPAYLDSLGWVLYKQKKYKEAKEPLLKATADPDGQDVVLYDHLGDVLWALGEKAEAKSAWKKATEVAGAARRDQERKAEVEKKLKERADR
jgi:tetratricopeptide (TPR) repeat protein